MSPVRRLAIRVPATARTTLATAHDNVASNLRATTSAPTMAAIGA